MIQAIRDIAFTGTGAQSQDINLDNDGIQAYRISINTVSQILGDKTVPFVGTPIDNLTVLDFILEGGMNTTGVSKLKIGGVTISDRFAANKCMVRFEYYNSSWNVFYYVDDSASGSIDGAQLIDDTVTPVKITDAIAGAGMERDGSGGVKLKLESSNSSLQIIGGETGVKLDSTGAIVSGPNGAKLNLPPVNPSLAITANEVDVKIKPDSGLEATATGVGVLPDPSGGLENTAAGIRMVNAPCTCIKMATLTLSSADILSLNTSPLTVVSPPGVGFVLEPISAMFFLTVGGVTYATNTELAITNNVGGRLFESDCLAGVQDGIWIMNRSTSSTSIPDLIENGRINVTVNTGNPTAGNGTGEVRVYYVVNPIPA